jgi:deoxyribodipyrimidine photo-lyase
MLKIACQPEMSSSLNCVRRITYHRQERSIFSPYLHFGQLSVHEVFSELVRREKWKPQKLSLRATGSREGWWNMSSAVDVFLDEIITWRELGYNFASHRDDYASIRSASGTEQQIWP